MTEQPAGTVALCVGQATQQLNMGLKTLETNHELFGVLEETVLELFSVGGAKEMYQGTEIVSDTKYLSHLQSSLTGITDKTLKGLLSDEDSEKKIIQNPLFAQTLIAGLSAITGKMLQEEENISTIMGHSLGEYTAMYLAGVFGEGKNGFTTFLKTIWNRSIAMDWAHFNRPGGMLLLRSRDKLDIDQINETCTTVSDGDSAYVGLSIDNTSHQAMVSGDTPKLKEIKPKFKKLGIRVRPMTTAAVHSPLMAKAEEMHEQFLLNLLKKKELKTSKIDIYSPIKEKLYKAGTIPQYLVNVLLHGFQNTVHWRTSVPKVIIENGQPVALIAPDNSNAYVEGIAQASLGDIKPDFTEPNTIVESYKAKH